jgi:glycosyltransferase involved in cell wall biosynthesis
MHEGGVERTAANLCRGLAERGYAVDLVLAQAEGPHLAEIPSSVRVRDLRATRVLASLPALVRYLQRERPGALLSMMCHANVVALWAKRLSGSSARAIVCEHNTLSRTARDRTNRRGWLMPGLVRRFYPWADGIVAVSTGVAEDLGRVAGLPGERIHVVYNAAVTRELRERARAPLDHPWFSPGAPPVIVAAGRMRPQKDFPTLIEAFARLRQTRPARLLILGEGPDRAALDLLVRRLGLERDVAMPGFIADPYPYIARAALFVLSSRWEGLPTVLIEALACGTPIVATDCPSGPREILADGRYGRLVPVADVPALAEALASSLAEGRQPPPPESWLRFDADRVVDQYARLLAGAP